ncbi:hypothetical protein Csa_021510 [Cucumis sativus]|uniref:Uncharacterized protein n=1 Tax=Cucumis sativus TaxID=3659 RepID=A0A0A0LVW0_CUCSA|nr:hypothetical protein Csa_021510 [Cucumis sativus]
MTIHRNKEEEHCLKTQPPRNENDEEIDTYPPLLLLKRKPTTTQVVVDLTKEYQLNKEPSQKKRRKLTTKWMLVADSPIESPHQDGSVPSTSLPTEQLSSLPREDNEDPFLLPIEDVFYPPPPIDPFSPKSPIS